MNAAAPLPIDEVLPQLKAALASGAVAVLVAPPGAGKTTRVPLALLEEPWTWGRKLVVLAPRRLAARAAAARMAETLGEAVGLTVGYRVRLESRISSSTRIEVVTEGVFTRMILDDPGLEGVAGVVFDEFHERSLDADLGLAFARDAQSVLREDLRLVVMSATLDGARVSALLGGAPVIESQGRSFPVETRYVGRRPGERLEAAVAQAVERALARDGGGVLVFLPGAGEIRRVQTLLAERLGAPDDIAVVPLYGALDPRDQDLALHPAAEGVRKVVLATSIAETSLTIPDVRLVVDAGLARVPRFDPASGLTRLETVRVSRAAADQRRGRAGRTAPGVCYRLWDAAETRALPPFARPEILESDLAGVALDLAVWGAKDTAGLALLDPPPAGAMAEAVALLVRLGALDAAQRLTPHGRRLARLPLAPRLGHMILRGAERGLAGRAARIAVLLTERGLGGTSVDLAERLAHFAADAGPRARDARGLAARWARLAGGADGGAGGGEPKPGVGDDDARLLAEAYPERIAKARDADAPGEFLLAGGRGARLDPADPLARETWLAIADLGGGAARDRILLAAAIGAPALRSAFADRMVAEETIAVGDDGRARGRSLLRLGALIVEVRAVVRPDPARVAAALLAHVGAHGLAPLPWGEGALRLRARIACLRALDGEVWPDLSDAALIASTETWLQPLLTDRTAVGDIPPPALEAALQDMVPWALRARLDREAPERFVTPLGSAVPIDYAAEGGPRVEVRVQELFGLARHPAIADGRLRLVLALLSPARRPVQVTRDLPGFWAGSWRAVRSEMRGRYPRHPWPEDPLAAPPTVRAKPRGT